MSRFDGDDGDYDLMTDADRRQQDEAIMQAYALAQGDLVGFLAHLDAMPDKRIIADRFVDPKSMLACSVGEFARFKAMPKLTLLKYEGKSYHERLENGEGDRDENGQPVGPEECGGFEGATVAAAISVGLGHHAAWDLAWRNDVGWQNLTPEDRWHALRGYIARKIKTIGEMPK